jgi:hypothetical protein
MGEIIQFPGGALNADPERQAAVAEVRILLEGAIDALPASFRTVFIALNRFAIETLSCAVTYFARFQTISSVRPEAVRGFVNFISSAVMDVTIRR